MEKDGVNKKKYALTMLVSDNYVWMAKVAIESFLHFNKWFDGDIIYVYEPTNLNLSINSKNLLSSLYTKTKFLETHAEAYAPIYKYLKDLLPTWKTNWMYTFYKYEVFSLDGYDKIINIDGDMLFLGSLKELFDSEIEFGMVSDVDGPLGDFYNGNRKQENLVEDYANCGLFVIGKSIIDLYTKDKIIEETISTNLNQKLSVNQHDIGHVPEQDFLNRIFFGKTVMLDKKYNLYNTCLDNNVIGLVTLFKERKLPIIIHYIDKPNRLLDSFSNEIFYTVLTHGFDYVRSNIISIGNSYINKPKPNITKNNKLLERTLISSNKRKLNCIKESTKKSFNRRILK